MHWKPTFPSGRNPAEPPVVYLRNRQRERRINGRYLRRVLFALLDTFDGLSRVELGIHLVSAAEITRLNQHYLQHAGTTDVITFDYREDAAHETELHGEVFLCVAEAVANARGYRTSWQREITRYLVHGLLHLRGFDDGTRSERRRMKREEDRLLRYLERRFPLRPLARSSKLAP